MKASNDLTFEYHDAVSASLNGLKVIIINDDTPNSEHLRVLRALRETKKILDLPKDAQIKLYEESMKELELLDEESKRNRNMERRHRKQKQQRRRK